MLLAKDISVSFGDREVLSRISFDLREGEIVALLGANGAGKTTLIRTLNGSIEPAAGQVLLDGSDMAALSRREIAGKIAVVAQENETRFPVPVLDFVLAGRFIHGRAFGWETENDLNYARGALIECDLDGFENRFMNHLSGGERQRVVLARALAAGTTTLLLDEPTANLDLAHQAMMFRLVRKRCLECRCSSVVITHDLNLASEFADRIILLKDGRIEAIGEPGEVLNAENVKSIFGVDVLLDENPVSRKVRVTAVY